ncbi:MAG: hypothetical protein A3J97_00760 [Spirochaetes bacterium RIFOXYC1_FULL_54_7]|nr:MAG: hypothetical protein A3J97_00760 [Spirochaetes bacterium RIFOXYC1_FULL_54_7]
MLHICFNLGMSSGRIQRERFLEDAFMEIEPFGTNKEARAVLCSVVLDRKNHAYLNVMELARLILEGLNVAGAWASTIRFNLFFPMEKVFEHYIYNLLLGMKSRGELASVQYQSNPYYLLSQYQEKRNVSFNLKPDLVVKTVNGENWIIDAKWKLLDEDCVDGKNQISQMDLYQLLSYVTIYREKSVAIDRLLLVYPRWSKLTRSMQYAYTDIPHTPLHVVPAPIECAEGWSLVV